MIVSEWKEFRSPDFDLIKIKLKTPVIFDRRNLYDPLLIRAMGFEYFAIGRLHAQPASTRPIAVATIPRIVSTQPELAPA